MRKSVSHRKFANKKAMRYIPSQLGTAVFLYTISGVFNRTLAGAYLTLGSESTGGKMDFQAIINHPYSLETFQTQVMQYTQDSIRPLIEKLFDNESVNRQIEIAENTINGQIAILRSMTIEEKMNPSVLNTSRLQRIADGSGKQVADIEQLLKQYQKMKKIMLRLNSKPKGNEPPPNNAAVMSIPKEFVITKAIGRKYGT
jgi:hypothetical protein